MLFNSHKIGIAITLLMTSTTALALPFNSFDPRSMAMGGAGVAIGDPGTAPLFNPALLSASDPNKKYSIELPIIGFRLSDTGNLRSEAPTLGDNITALGTSIMAVNASANGTTVAQLQQLPRNMTTVANDIDKVNTSLSALSNKPLQGEFGAATVVGVPGKNVGMAFYANAWGAMGGTLLYKDATILGNLSTAARAAADALTTATNPATADACLRVQNGTGTPTALQADVATCLAGATAIQTSLVNAQGVVQFDSKTQIASQVHLRGVAAAEAGLSLSHAFVTNGHEWALGVTPKLMQLKLFDALIDANSGDLGKATGNDFLANYTAFNFDLGVAKNYNNGWSTGFVVKNVIPQSFAFKRAPTAGATPVATGATLNLNPQARVGVSHANSWSTVALDVDITKNDPAGLENKSQFIGLGGELSAWGWAQLRAGYRLDLVNSARNIASVGLGFSPRIPYFKIHGDIALAGNANEAGLSMRAGFNF